MNSMKRLLAMVVCSVICCLLLSGCTNNQEAGKEKQTAILEMIQTLRDTIKALTELNNRLMDLLEQAGKKDSEDPKDEDVIASGPTTTEGTEEADPANDAQGPAGETEESQVTPDPATTDETASSAITTEPNPTDEAGDVTDEATPDTESDTPPTQDQTDESPGATEEPGLENPGAIEAE